MELLSRLNACRIPFSGQHGHRSFLISHLPVLHFSAVAISTRDFGPTRADEINREGLSQCFEWLGKTGTETRRRRIGTGLAAVILKGLGFPQRRCWEETCPSQLRASGHELRLEPSTTSYSNAPLNAFGSLRSHWPEYLMEASESASYMFFVCTFATLLLHPISPVSHLIHSGLYRRALMGLLVGSAVVAIVLTPWGKQSGGHFNPVITLTFYRLGKLSFWDMLFYVISQFMGAIIGVGLAACILRDAPRNPSVHYAVTTPGIFGNVGAFTGELAISYILMTAILLASSSETLARFTPYLVGALYTTFITFESPLSGMSMNPARTLGSAFWAGCWQGFWIYLLAPAIGMLVGAEMFLWARGGIGPYCGKLDHDGDKRCIFRHGYAGRESKVLTSSSNQNE